MTAILRDLAAGVIDAAEAARRIDALPKTQAVPTQNAEKPIPHPARSESARNLDDDIGPVDAEIFEDDDDSATRDWTQEAHPDADPAAGEVMDAEPTLIDAEADEPTKPGESPKRAVGDRSGSWGNFGAPQFASFLKDTFLRDAPGKREDSQRSVPPGKGVKGISVRGVGRRVRILGDPSVATVSVEGPHVLRRNGAMIEITSDGDIGPSLDGFSIIRPPHTLEDFRSLGVGKELVIRVNPALPVDVEVTAGTLTTRKVPHLGKVRLTAGGGRLHDVVEITDALIQAANARVYGPISEGRSRIRIESGTLTVHLAADSNVTVRSDTNLGRVSWPGEASGNFDEYVVGTGSARLDIAVVMGHAAIRIDSEEARS